ncbi:hypothetical protein ACQ4PT_053744 [Festuca glaucescens]
MRKKVDERIRTLIENGVRQRQRSMFIIVGDKSRDQIVNLNYMLAKSRVKSRPSVLWCYRNKLEISSHRKKRAKQLKKLMQRGLMDPDKADPFSLFLETSDITYCQYKDSERVLGNTFGMCILQDFEALTPNLLARTIETVEGGGLIILLLSSLSSLTSLYTMVMDVHERFRTESHTTAATRFNERFLLSIASCKACIVMDDELNILPISSHMKFIQPVTNNEDSEGLSERERELKDLKDQFRQDFPVGPLIGKCCTMDQGKAVINFLDSILDKSLRSTVALLAARGRGKSAALGLAIAGAVAAGYSNIFVTAPSPENLNTLFDFVCKGMNALEYKEHLHYDVVKSADPNLRKATIQINVHKQHRQTIQYMKPHDHGKLSQVELLVIDEAAAIPLPIVKSLLGPYLVFLSSTVNGYEGTGRSLSLKLLQKLESQSQPSASSDAPNSSRLFKKIELNESIRYASGDPIETWLNELLCLDLANSIPNISRLPHPKDCELYYVNRDTLFSYHKESEVFLQRMMALYVASHYKNSPNDLQLMADAPAHHLFVLLGQVNESENQLPDILCVIQVWILYPDYLLEDLILIFSADDCHWILDLVPILAHEYFSEKLPVTLHGAQASVLFCMGLQDKDISATKEELGIEREQVLSNFIKTMKKLYGYLHNTAGKEIEATLPRLKEIEMAPLSRSMDEDLDEAAEEVKEKRRAAEEATVDPKLLQKYAIDSDAFEIEKALQDGKLSGSGVISVKSSKTNADKKEKHKEKSKRKETDGSRSSKKKRT